MANAHDYDKVLFKRIQSDDRLALNTLFAAHYQNLCSFANTYLHNKEEAEESVADVFVNLWKNRKNLSVEKNFKAYLYMAVKYAAFAALRKRNPAFKDIDTLPDTFASESSDPEQVVLYEELEQRIENAVETLPARCRQVFVMSRMEGLTYKEIATILNISENTVENHLVKALHILRDLLRPPKELKTITLTES